jgi:DUF2075 family protein
LQNTKGKFKIFVSVSVNSQVREWLWNGELESIREILSFYRAWYFAQLMIEGVVWGFDTNILIIWQT